MVDNKGTIIYVDPSKWFQVGSNLFNKNTNGNVAIGVIDTSSFKPVDYSRLYISNGGSTTLPVLKLDTPFDGELTDDVLTWDPSDFSVKKIAISTLSPNDWHILGNAGTDPATNFLGTTDNQDLSFRTYNTERMRIASSGNIGIGTVAPASTLEINSTAANTSGLRLTNLTSASPASTGATIGVNAAGDVVVVNSSVTATTVSNTSTGNTLTTTVNDVTGTAVNIINSNTLTATDGKLVSTVNGVETTPEVPILISANNGLTATSGNVQLDGALIKPTTITTDATNTLAVAGLQSASPTGTDNIVVVNSSGVLSTIDRSILNNGWLLKGNAGTNPANNFLGTTDDQPLFFRINDNYAGHIAQNNTSLGNSSLNPSATGQFNTAMGSNSLSALSDGTYNTATGFQNFQGLTSGSYNVAMGVENIGALTSGWNNIAIGAGNLSIETGNQNIAIGAGVGQGLLNGSSNILIGGSTSYRIDASGPNKSNEMNIGNALFGKAINSAIGTASIGINTNNPGNTFEVKSAAANTSGLRLSNLTSTSPATATSVATLGINATGDVVVVNSAPATTTNTLTATNGSLISTVNGIATIPAVPVLTSANNGLTATNGNVQLGGTLVNPTTTITTNGATNTLAIAGLQATTDVTDNLVLANPSTGLLRTITFPNLPVWTLVGNLGTTVGTNYLGTNDAQPLMFKVNKVQSGLLTTNNTSFGYQALLSVPIATTINNNTAMGTNALTALNSGTGENTAVGFNTINISTNSVANTAVGSYALAKIGNSTDGRNTAVGYLAMAGSNTTAVTVNTGSNNTAIGISAMNNASTALTGVYNVAIGANALTASAGGSYNTALGPNAGKTINGNNNIMIGGSSSNNINPSSAAVSNELNIGNTLFGTGINGTIGIGKIGINIQSPLVAELQVLGSVRTGTSTTGTIGQYSFAGGTNSVASATGSFAYGNGATASSGGATPVGYNTAFGGATASANGGYAFAAGVAIASGSYSAAFGSNSTTAGGNSSFAAGNKNIIDAGSGNSALFGVNNNIYSTATPIGGGTPGVGSFAAGNANKIYSQNSVALGSQNIMNYTTAGTAATPQGSVALGSGNTTDGNSTIAMGTGNTSSGTGNVAMGGGNIITNGSTYSIAAGNGNYIGDVAAAVSSFTAGGANHINSSSFSNALGQTNTITGSTASTIIGQNNSITSANNALVMGIYATIPTGYNGATILADASGGSTIISSTAANQFTGMFNGGYRFFTNRNNQTNRGLFINDDNTGTGRAKVGINNPTPNADLDVQGSQVVKVAIATGSYAVKTNDYMLVVPSGSSPANTITLPSAAANTGRVLMIKTSIINTSSVTVKTSSASEKFDGSWPASAISGGPIAGSTSILLDSTGINDHITVISDGTSWYVSN
ncbi:hypothetical protein HYN56_20755 [Flavobacterium crocinum]|uniref:Trimeric autotransporter adhesin YadA-like head domain-containing protein n=1 Tax=Flavobacterium crocinum TaxID=2183896 RepID=A0A2S1YR92_9FLAO|nr:hypothetical protein HYN56_20755 [Flavobacterium crocinum]